MNKEEILNILNRFHFDETSTVNIFLQDGNRYLISKDAGPLPIILDEYEPEDILKWIPFRVATIKRTFNEDIIITKIIWSNGTIHFNIHNRDAEKPYVITLGLRKVKIIYELVDLRLNKVKHYFTDYPIMDLSEFLPYNFDGIDFTVIENE